MWVVVAAEEEEEEEDLFKADAVHEEEEEEEDLFKANAVNEEEEGCLRPIPSLSVSLNTHTRVTHTSCTIKSMPQCPVHPLYSSSAPQLSLLHK